MRNFFFISLISLLLSISAYAADINIKLRKMDVNDLKSQIIPAFDNNMTYLDRLLVCLEQKKSISICLDNYPLNTDGQDVVASSEKNLEIKKLINKTVQEKNIQTEELVFQLKKHLSKIKKTRSCLNDSKTVNEQQFSVFQKFQA